MAGAAVCGAVSGAIGGLVEQGFKCAKDHAQCAASAFLKSGLVGGAIGGLSGLGGAIGGKFLKLVGGKALTAIGGLFSRGAQAAVEGTAESAGRAGAEGATESAASSAEDSSASRAAEDPTDSADSSAEDGSGCGGAPHSFVGSTRVLLANGKTKAIDQIKVGDKVRNSVPGESGTETHTVARVIVTKTDHDFVTLKITPERPGKLTRAAFALAAGVVAVASLTTTFHHPFYDRTQAAFVEAKDLARGDELQTVTGMATVVDKHLYHAAAVTYDLTIGGLHTYYVLAGKDPVLVHNTRPCIPTPNIIQKGLDHSFDRHAEQWFGRPVSKADKMSEWNGLIERAAGSSKVVPWSSGSTLTNAHCCQVPTVVARYLSGLWGGFIPDGLLSIPRG